MATRRKTPAERARARESEKRRATPTRMTLYVGFDGSYVVSSRPLVKAYDTSGGNHYLSPATGKCIDIDDGALVFGVLGLKMYEVAKLEISVEHVRAALPVLAGGGAQ